MLLLTPLARWLARRLNAIDHADGERKLHGQPMPLLGGVALLVAVVASMLALCVIDPVAAAHDLGTLLAILAGAALICLVGFVDDLRGLRVRWKLLGQFAATLPLLLHGEYARQLGVGDHVLNLGASGIPLTVAWFLACINALNFLDGVDGLASLVGLATACMVAAIALTLGHTQVGLLAMVLAGSLAGFLVYNLPPARIYLGDAGSMLIGFLLSVMALRVSTNAQGVVSSTTPLALLAIPALDICLAIVRRTLTGRRFWIADRSHIHHRLLDRGLSIWQTVGLLGALSLLTGGAAFVACVLGSERAAWCILGVLAIGLVRGRWCGHQEWELCRQLLLRRMLNLVSRLGTGRFQRGLPTSDELVTTPFAQAWGLFTRKVERHRVVRLDVKLVRERGSSYHQAWGEATLLDGDRNLWAIETLFDSADEGWCQVRALVQEGPASQPLNWLALLDVIRHFGRHWAAHPAPFVEACQGSAEPWRVVGAETEARMPARAEQSRSEAA